MTTTITSTSVTTTIAGGVIVENDLLDGRWAAEIIVDGVLIGALVRDSYEAVSFDAGYALGVWLRQVKEGTQ